MSRQHTTSTTWSRISKTHQKAILQIAKNSWFVFGVRSSAKCRPLIWTHLNCAQGWWVPYVRILSTTSAPILSLPFTHPMGGRGLYYTHNSKPVFSTFIEHLQIWLTLLACSWLIIITKGKETEHAWACPTKKSARGQGKDQSLTANQAPWYCYIHVAFYNMRYSFQCKGSAPMPIGQQQIKNPYGGSQGWDIQELRTVWELNFFELFANLKLSVCRALCPLPQEAPWHPLDNPITTSQTSHPETA